MPVPHQPPNNIPLASSLPKVSFRKIPEEEANQLLIPAGTQNAAHITFGFNDGCEFERPEHYLRHVEPIESELNQQVEYDMDEQDQEWLDALNIERYRDQLGPISYEIFEIIIDRLEKEWFDLMKRVPVKPIPIALGADGQPIGDGSEDIECAICDDGECENSNAIVFCDGCNLAVHQDCYGIPYIPEGQWLCRKCTVSPDRAVSCVLCPHEGGAFKQTTQGKWAHLLCAMWIPETGVSNQVYMEPIDSVERIPKARWKLQCYLCKYKNGACIQCDNKNCFTAFHVTCARRANLLLKSQRQRITHSHNLDSDDEESSDILRAWCHKHIPKSLRAERARQREKEEGEMFEDASSQPRSESPNRDGGHRKNGQSQSMTTLVTTAPGRKKSARAYKKSYRAGPSLVPVYVLNRVLEHLTPLKILKKPQLVIQIAKFWSLKREARRGAPLLKRLHLEPWTASTSNKEQSDAERIKKLQFLLRLREDLEKVRMLAELVRKREKEKLKQVQIIREALVNSIIFPFHEMMRKTLERVSAIDKSDLFLLPVSPQKVPDYFEVIKRPMDWTSIASKIDDFQYISVTEFIEDMHLVLDNAMLYNKLDTVYHRSAARIKKLALPIFEELDRLKTVHGDQQDLQLEAEESFIALLEDYNDENRTSNMDGSNNAIEEMTRQFYIVDPPSMTSNAEMGTGTKINGLSRKAVEKAARSERSRLAAQRRKEAQQARKEALGEVRDGLAEEGGEGEMEEEEGDDDDDEDEEQQDGEEMIGGKRSIKKRRMSKRESALKASRAGAEARKRRAGERARGEKIKNDDEEGDDSISGILEVEQINNKDSFTLFNSGWVLPAGSKRRPATLGHSEPNGLRLLSERSRSSTSLANAQREPSSELSEPGDESVDTSFQDRGSNGLKRKKRDSSESSNEPPPRGYLRRSIGQVDAPASKGRPDPKKGSVYSRKKKEGKSKKNARGEYEISTLCWAKVEGHSFYPAEVFDPEDSVVPARVKQGKDSVMIRDGDGPLFLVRFFDDIRSFAWIPANKLKLLFEDEEVDSQMLKGSKKHDRKKIKDAFERAQAVVEV